MIAKLMTCAMVFVIASVAFVSRADAQFTCQAELNAYGRAMAAFNANPTPDNAFAVAQTQANYQNCMNGQYGGPEAVHK
jgi:hypothetical protein